MPETTRNALYSRGRNASFWLERRFDSRRRWRAFRCRRGRLFWDRREVRQRELTIAELVARLMRCRRGEIAVRMLEEADAAAILTPVVAPHLRTVVFVAGRPKLIAKRWRSRKQRDRTEQNRKMLFHRPSPDEETRKLSRRRREFARNGQRWLIIRIRTSAAEELSALPTCRFRKVVRVTPNSQSHIAYPQFIVDTWEYFPLMAICFIMMLSVAWGMGWKL